MKINLFLFLFIPVMLFSGCSSPSSESDSDSALPDVSNCSIGKPAKGRFYVSGKAVAFRNGPGEKYDQVINQKFSEVTGRTEYRTLDSAYGLEGLCQTEQWLQAKIVEADGSPMEWETGWVNKKFVTGNMSPEHQAGLFWDFNSDSSLTTQEKKLLTKAAYKVLKDEPNCSKVTFGAPSTNEKGKYFITCTSRKDGESFNIWFTPQGISDGKNINAPKVLPEQQAREACENEIKAKVSHPSTLEIHRLLGYTSKEHNNGNRTIIQEFSAKNGFDLKLKSEARCLVMPHGQVELTIKETSN